MSGLQRNRFRPGYFYDQERGPVKSENLFSDKRILGLTICGVSGRL